MKKLTIALALVCTLNASAQMRCWLVGDVDNSGSINLTDLVVLSNHLFSGGPGPERSRQADFDENGQIDTADLVLLARYLYEGCNTCLGPLDTFCEFHPP